MYIENLINKFGYSEMYEWSELFKYDIIPFGRFVSFDKNEPGKIKLANDNDSIIGVTTINSTITSDDPNEWQGKYLCNQYGDILLHESQNNSQNDEKQYSGSIINKQVIPIINEYYNPKLNYIKRSNRNEWVRVNIIGKCIIVHDGTINSGDICTIGKNGIGTLASNMSRHTYYVIDKLTDKTALIFFK